MFTNNFYPYALPTGDDIRIIRTDLINGSYYHTEVDRYQYEGRSNKVDDFICSDPTKISWNRGLKNDFASRIAFGEVILDSFYELFYSTPVYLKKAVCNKFGYTSVIRDDSKSQSFFFIKGDGFLKNMVRIIVGTLVDIGRGKNTPAKIHSTIAACDRTAAGMTAPAHGLVLRSVEYSKN